MADILKTNMTRNALSAVSFTAANPSSTVETGADDRMVLSVRNTQTEVKTLTIKAGKRSAGRFGSRRQRTGLHSRAYTGGERKICAGVGCKYGPDPRRGRSRHRTGLLRSALTERTRAAVSRPHAFPERRSVMYKTWGEIKSEIINLGFEQSNAYAENPSRASRPSTGP